MLTSIIYDCVKVNLELSIKITFSAICHCELCVGWDDGKGVRGDLCVYKNKNKSSNKKNTTKPAAAPHMHEWWQQRVREWMNEKLIRWYIQRVLNYFPLQPLSQPLVIIQSSLKYFMCRL